MQFSRSWFESYFQALTVLMYAVSRNILALPSANSTGRLRSSPRSQFRRTSINSALPAAEWKCWFRIWPQNRSGNDKKLLKLLGRLRKKAGRVRDLDVQSAALRSLKIPQEPGRKSQLMRTLAEERAKREKKLVKSLDKQTIAEVRKRLKRTAASLEIPRNADPLASPGKS